MTIKQIIVGSIVSTIIVGATAHKLADVKNSVLKATTSLASKRSSQKMHTSGTTKEVTGKKALFRSSRPA